MYERENFIRTPQLGIVIGERIQDPSGEDAIRIKKSQSKTFEIITIRDLIALILGYPPHGVTIVEFSSNTERESL